MPRGTWRERRRRASIWVFRRRLAFGGLAGALVFLCLSLTPSMLPRAALLQGVISGIALAVGYGLGSAASSAVRAIGLREPTPGAKSIAWRGLVVTAVVLVPLFLLLGRYWQDQARSLMDMPSQPVGGSVVILLVAAVMAALLLVLARVVRGVGRAIARGIDRFVPRSVALGLGATATVVIVIGLFQGFVLNPAISALNASFSVVNEGTADGIVQPTVPQRSGSAASVVPWDSLGVQGRTFIGSGPSVPELEAFAGAPARQPVRVYVGLESATTLTQRIDLALRELDRAGAWERNVLTVFTTTGTGWVNGRSADALEYLHRGDTALLALQYSYLPSWISFLVDQEKAAETGRRVIDAVQARWSQLPQETRPHLLLYGESLGSYGTEQAFEGIDDLVDGPDGALLVGPVFQNEIHSRLTAERDPSSPYWRPVWDEGRNVRFVVSPPDLSRPDTQWSRARIVYLQNASDPITYWRPELLWRPPAWLDHPRGPDIPRRMFWLPIITFFQTAADMAYSTGVPAGHGHVYGANPVDAWAAILPPEGWTEADTGRLRAIIGHE